MNLSEEAIVYALYALFSTEKKHVAYNFNTKFLHDKFESDYISLTKYGYLHEIEIKLTRKDFVSDFRKTTLKRNEVANLRSMGESPPASTMKHEMIQRGYLGNYFWFAIPKGMVSKEKVPDYCGIMSLGYDQELAPVLEVVRNAPLLTKRKLDLSVAIPDIQRGCMHRAMRMARTVARMKLGEQAKDEKKKRKQYRGY